MCRAEEKLSKRFTRVPLLKCWFKQCVVEPCVVDARKGRSANDAVSINNILKLAVDWKSQDCRELKVLQSCIL